MYKQLAGKLFVVTVFALLLAAPGCSSDPTEPQVTLEDLLADFRIEMTSTSGAGGGTSLVTAATRSSSVFESPPSENQFTVLGPNLNVFAWPIIQDVPITARWQGSTGETMVLSWPDVFSRSVWPDLDVAGGVRYGNTWVVYPAGGNPNNWVAQHTEWIRRPGETTGTVFPFEEKLEAAEPCGNCPIGQFVAGPSRHVTNQPEYRRRTAIKWFRYGDMRPWVWSEGEPEPKGADVLEEVHVFIQGLQAQLEGGTVVTFDDEIGDVDLMVLLGQKVPVVDSEVPRGTFTNITFNIDPARSYVVFGGEQRPLNFSSGTVVVNGPVVVGDAPITTVTLQFDLDASLTENADGSWTMAPVVVISVTTG